MGIGPKFSTGMSYTPATDTSPNPNKYRFTIQECEYKNGFALILATYPDCTTFGGAKLMIIETKVHPRNLIVLDPHFLPESPTNVIARFEPTKRGIDLAGMMFEALTSK